VRASPLVFLASFSALVSLPAAAQQVAPPAAERAEPAAAPPRVDPAVSEREQLPLEYPPPSARTNLALAGTGIFVGWYGLALGASVLEPDAPGSTDLRIPVAGPWMAVAQAGCAKGNPDCSTAWVVVRAILQAMDGVGQAGGLLVLGEALFLPTRDHVRPQASDEQRAVRNRASLAPRIRAVPFVGDGDSVGLGLHGTF
jgi:hypothetical protein